MTEFDELCFDVSRLESDLGDTTQDVRDLEFRVCSLESADAAFRFDAELETRIEAQEREIEALNKTVSELLNRIATLESWRK
jgi:chromosome segregation ATPase